MNTDPKLVQNIPDSLDPYVDPRLIEPTLCFIQRPWAFFTTQPLTQQTGDRWNEGPWDCASPPHSPSQPRHFRLGDEEQPMWAIHKLAFDGNWWVPRPYLSVRDILRHKAPWLEAKDVNRSGVQIYAGVMIPEFMEEIEKGGGRVYCWMPFGALAAIRGY
jgi:hypothetical protein